MSSIFRRSVRLDPAVLRLPHGVLHLLNDIVEFDSRQALRNRSLGDGHRHRRGHASQVVDLRQQRRAGLAHGDPAGHGTRRRGELVVGEAVLALVG